MFLFTNTLLFLAIGAYSFIWIYHGFFILGLSIIVSYYLHFNYFSPLKVSTGSFVIAYLLILGSLLFLTYFYFWFDIFMIEEAYMLKASRSVGSRTTRGYSSSLSAGNQLDLTQLLGNMSKLASTHPTYEAEIANKTSDKLAGLFKNGSWPLFDRPSAKGSNAELANNGLVGVAHEVQQSKEVGAKIEGQSIIRALSTHNEEQKHKAPDMLELCFNSEGLVVWAKRVELKLIPNLPRDTIATRQFDQADTYVQLNRNVPGNTHTPEDIAKDLVAVEQELNLEVRELGISSEGTVSAQVITPGQGQTDADWHSKTLLDNMLTGQLEKVRSTKLSVIDRIEASKPAHVVLPNNTSYVESVIASFMIADSPHVCLRNQEFRASITVESVSEDSS
jgi:hypothetical protein